MMSLILPSMVAFVLLISGCSDEPRIVNTAPSASEDLGHIIFGATTEQKDLFFNSQKHTKIRPISNEPEIFEIINSDYESLKKAFPQSRILKNEFLYQNNIQKPVQLNLQNLKDSQFNTTATAVNFNTCKNLSLKPVASMTPVSVNLKSKSRTVMVSENIQISSQDSQAHAFVGGDINKTWLVQAPMGSNVNQFYTEDTLDIKLDTMGTYQINLIVQDKKLNCQIQSIAIYVTGNTPYKGAISSRLNENIGKQTYISNLGLVEAHQTTKGEGIVIAIIDTGVNYNHPYLSENIALNSNEIEGNGLDDDKNGLVDDIYGWDFVNGDQFPNDDAGHGSHVAGLAAAKVFGVAPNAKILPIKAMNAFGLGDIGTTFQGILYAIKMKAHVINLSLGSERKSFKQEIDLFKAALQSNIVIVAASGNGAPTPRGVSLGFSIDTREFMPAGIATANLLSVSALNNNNELAYYSNFGKNKVGVATYGGEDVDIKTGSPYNGTMISAYLENPKNILFFPSQGTSMAAPVASGITALVRSHRPQLNAGEVVDLLEGSGLTSSALRGKIKSEKILTAKDAIESADKIAFGIN